MKTNKELKNSTHRLEMARKEFDVARQNMRNHGDRILHALENKDKKVDGKIMTPDKIKALMDEYPEFIEKVKTSARDVRAAEESYHRAWMKNQ